MRRYGRKNRESRTADGSLSQSDIAAQSDRLAHSSCFLSGLAMSSQSVSFELWQKQKHTLEKLQKKMKPQLLLLVLSELDGIYISKDQKTELKQFLRSRLALARVLYNTAVNRASLRGANAYPGVLPAWPMETISHSSAFSRSNQAIASRTRLHNVSPHHTGAEELIKAKVSRKLNGNITHPGFHWTTLGRKIMTCAVADHQGATKLLQRRVLYSVHPCRRPMMYHWLYHNDVFLCASCTHMNHRGLKLFQRRKTC